MTGDALGDWTADQAEAREASCRAYACPEELFEREYKRLVESLSVVAADREAAADAVQEAFIRLVPRWDRVSSYEDPVGWVRRVALNRIHDHRRSLWTQARLLLKLEQERRVPRGVPATNERLHAQLAALPIKQRTALALYYMEHLTTREVAGVMRVSEGTVKQHLHRAKQSLREALKETGDD